MDKVTPKSDVFQANRDRVAPLLEKLKAEGIGHKTVPSISGATFETTSPVDGAVLAEVARGDGGDYSFDFHMETKHVSLARGTQRIQKLGVIQPPSFRGDAQHRTRNLEIPGSLVSLAPRNDEPRLRTPHARSAAHLRSSL